MWIKYLDSEEDNHWPKSAALKLMNWEWRSFSFTHTWLQEKTQNTDSKGIYQNKRLTHWLIHAVYGINTVEVKGLDTSSTNGISYLSN